MDDMAIRPAAGDSHKSNVAFGWDECRLDCMLQYQGRFHTHCGVFQEYLDPAVTEDCRSVEDAAVVQFHIELHFGQPIRLPSSQERDSDMIVRSLRWPIVPSVKFNCDAVQDAAPERVPITIAMNRPPRNTLGNQERQAVCVAAITTNNLKREIYRETICAYRTAVDQDSDLAIEILCEHDESAGIVPRGA